MGGGGAGGAGPRRCRGRRNRADGALGPLLHFRGQAGDRWRLAALVAGEGRDPPAPLEPEGGGPPAAPELLAARRGVALWRHDFALPLRDVPSAAAYAIPGLGRWTVRLPGLAGARRVAYAACNGSEDEAGIDGREAPPSRDALWRGLAAEHAREPFHLLLHGGDQLYADTLWEEVPELAAWRRLSWRRGNEAPFTPSMADAADAYYLRRYLWLWSRPDVAPLLASIPSLMMWDDHDVFDGWGSWPGDRQGCPVFKGLGAIAREHFALFQLAARPDALPEGFGDPRGGHFGFAFRAGGGVGVVAPDLRSERTRERVMGGAGWSWLGAALGGLAGCRHILVMSSVPLVNAHLGPLERALVALPGHSDLEDDLRDQWQSHAHRDEWRRVLGLLAGFSARAGAAVTSLSGEIHMGALGLVEAPGGVRIRQLTASGIVHPPPPALAAAAYGLLGRRAATLAPGLTARLLRMPGQGRRYYLRERNWLALDLAADGGLAAAWHAERGVAGRLAVEGDE